MESYTINKDEWHYKFIKHNYGYDYADEMPKDFCTYFQKLALAIFLLPITWVTQLGKRMGLSARLGCSFIIHFFYGLSYFIGMMIYAPTKGDESLYDLICYDWWTFIVYPLTTLIIAFITGGIVVGVISLWTWIERKIDKRNYHYDHKPKRDGLLKTKYKAWKEKHCALVEYE